MSQPSNKKPRLVELSGSTAPDGYHYEGEPARFFNGSITKRLRKNILPAQSREQMYSDLYCAVCTPASTEGAKDTLAFHCSICSEIVPMFFKTNGLVVFSNFFQHLEKKHAEYLIEADRTLVSGVPSAPSEPRASDMRTYFTAPRTIEPPIAAAPSPSVPRAESRFKAQADSILREKITQAVVEVIAHGPYPISFLQNPAIVEFLTKLNVVRPDFKLHSRRTVTKRLDDFLDTEAKSHNDRILSIVDTVSLSWDEWTSKADENYMGVNISSILPDFSSLFESMIAVNLFKYPHEMPDIRRKVIKLAHRGLFSAVAIPLEANEEGWEEGEILDSFLKKVKSLTYDGAAANYAFSPDPLLTGLTQREKAERNAVCARYSTVEERRCFCHRIIKLLQHCLDDNDNPASELYQKVFDDMYGFFTLISRSQKNLQELRRVQELDEDRVGGVIFDIRAPETR